MIFPRYNCLFQLFISFESDHIQSYGNSFMAVFLFSLGQKNNPITIVVKIVRYAIRMYDSTRYRRESIHNRSRIDLCIRIVRITAESRLNHMYRVIDRYSIDTEIHVKKSPNKRKLLPVYPHRSIPIANNREFKEGFKPILRSLKNPSN